MTRVVIMCAGPTAWDAEDRIGGDHNLPLSAEGLSLVRQRITELTDIPEAIFYPPDHEACLQTAQAMAERFKIRPKAIAELGPMRLGLWQGLTRQEMAHRFPSVREQWEDNPLAVHPPEGESVPQAVERLNKGLRRVLRKNRGRCIAIISRSLSMQIIVGLLHDQTPLQIAAHLHLRSRCETIQLSDPLWTRRME